MRRQLGSDTRTSYFVPGEGWSGKESPEATLKLVAEKVFSFSTYNRNHYYLREGEGWQEASPEELSGLERGHDYTLLPQLLKGKEEVYYVTAPRVPDQETEELLEGLNAFSIIPHYGRQRKVICFDWTFYLPAKGEETFISRVEELGGKTIISRVELAQIEQKASQIESHLQEGELLLSELEGVLPQVDGDTEQLERVERIALQLAELQRKGDRALRELQSLVEGLESEFGRPAEKARVRTMLTRAQGQLARLEEIGSLAEAGRERARHIFQEALQGYSSEKTKLTEELIAQVLDELGISPTQVELLRDPQAMLVELLREWGIAARPHDGGVVFTVGRHTITLAQDGAQVECPFTGRWGTLRLEGAGK